MWTFAVIFAGHFCEKFAITFPENFAITLILSLHFPHRMIGIINYKLPRIFCISLSLLCMRVTSSSGNSIRFFSGFDDNSIRFFSGFLLRTGSTCIAETFELKRIPLQLHTAIDFFFAVLPFRSRTLSYTT